MNRRGIALMAALWFVVAIATVGLALGLEANEHRAAGLAAADHRAAEAAAAGGLAIAQARLERALRQLPRNGASAASRFRTADPWIDPDSLWPDTLHLGDFVVQLHGVDLQSKLNISAASVSQLRDFLGFILKDFTTADALAQAIADWRDRDDFRLPRGAERDDYLAQHQLDLPTNRGGFRNLEELRAVRGMTPEIFDRIRPYLRLQGNDAAINVNTAPVPVLRAIPGVTDGAIARILAVRSQRQRINSVEELGGPEFLQPSPGQELSFVTTQIALTVTVTPPAAPVVREMWSLQQTDRSRADVRWTDFGH